jgi:cyclic pyranopterin phosphate synthase
MPSEGVSLSPKIHLLTTAEILKLARIFVEQGITKIRLTGGEPTVRKDFMDVIGINIIYTAELNKLKEIGLQKLGITTNGIALKRKLPLLKLNGLDQINISLDTLDPLKFQLLTRRPGHHLVMDSIESALDLGFESVKLNVVVINKVNDGEILDFVELTKNLPIYIRFIEYMPFDGNKWNTEKFLSFRDMLNMIGQKYSTIDKCKDEPNDTSKVSLQ